MKSICAVLTLSLSLFTSSALATQYNVNRSFTEGISTATLTGTLDIPVGNYLIENAGPSPFTAVNLTLTVDATSYNLTNALTDIINGSGQFLIEATPTTLTFSTNADILNPADLVFSDTIFSFSNNRYVVGYNGVPGFEAAYTDAGSVIANVTFPIVFGTAVVPEPSAALLLGIGLMGLGFLRHHS